MQNTLLLVLAWVIDTLFTIPLTVVVSIQNRRRLSAYHFNIALHYDYKWCSQLFYGYDGHTVSAVIYKKAYIEHNDSYVKYVLLVNWLFNDDFHCLDAYVKEFVKRGEACQ